MSRPRHFIELEEGTEPEVMVTREGERQVLVTPRPDVSVAATYGGAAGPPGPPGPQGPQGPRGTGLEGIQGQVLDADELPGAGGVGEAWLTGDGDLWIWKE